MPCCMTTDDNNPSGCSFPRPETSHDCSPYPAGHRPGRPADADPADRLSPEDGPESRRRAPGRLSHRDGGRESGAQARDGQRRSAEGPDLSGRRARRRKGNDRADPVRRDQPAAHLAGSGGHGGAGGQCLQHALRVPRHRPHARGHRRPDRRGAAGAHQRIAREAGGDRLDGRRQPQSLHQEAGSPARRPEGPEDLRPQRYRQVRL